METITQNHNQSKYKAKEPSLNRYVYNTAPSPKSLGSLLKKGQKDFKTWKIRGFAMRQCLLIMSDATPMKSHQHY